MSKSWSSVMNPEACKSPAFIALVSVLCVALLLLLHHFVLVTCCRGGNVGSAADRRRRRQHHYRHQQQQEAEEEEDEDVSISVEATSRTHLVQAQAQVAAVVCRYRKEEKLSEPTCAVCLAEFGDGEAVRVLPECLHYFHAECPMCRASLHHLYLSVSVSLEESVGCSVLVRSRAGQSMSAEAGWPSRWVESWLPDSSGDGR